MFEQDYIATKDEINERNKSVSTEAYQYIKLYDFVREDETFPNFKRFDLFSMSDDNRTYYKFKVVIKEVNPPVNPSVAYPPFICNAEVSASLSGIDANNNILWNDIKIDDVFSAISAGMQSLPNTAPYDEYRNISVSLEDKDNIRALRFKLHSDPQPGSNFKIQIVPVVTSTCSLSGTYTGPDRGEYRVVVTDGPAKNVSVVFTDKTTGVSTTTQYNAITLNTPFNITNGVSISLNETVTNDKFVIKAENGTTSLYPFVNLFENDISNIPPIDDTSSLFNGNTVTIDTEVAGSGGDINDALSIIEAEEMAKILSGGFYKNLTYAESVALFGAGYNYNDDTYWEDALHDEPFKIWKCYYGEDPKFIYYYLFLYGDILATTITLSSDYRIIESQKLTNEFLGDDPPTDNNPDPIQDSYWDAGNVRYNKSNSEMEIPAGYSFNGGDYYYRFEIVLRKHK